MVFGALVGSQMGVYRVVLGSVLDQPAIRKKL